MKLYGIGNCSTVKKARSWLAQHGLDIPFSDFKKEKPEKKRLERWVNEAGWEKLLNRRGTTWRTLSRDEQEKITDGASAMTLMLEKPSIIKRPVLEIENRIIVGFEESEYASLFGQK